MDATHDVKNSSEVIVLIPKASIDSTANTFLIDCGHPHPRLLSALASLLATPLLTALLLLLARAEEEAQVGKKWENLRGSLLHNYQKQKMTI